MCVLFAQSCLTLRNPMDRGLLGSSVHGISQARTINWVASQAIFLAQGSNPRLLNWQADSSPLRLLGKRRLLPPVCDFY